MTIDDSKKYLICLLSLVCASAHAQSSVTLYGMIDSGIRYMNHADKADNPVVGGEVESRWGLRGLEDLGGGNQVIFQLENRFFSDTGQSDEQSSRVVYAGRST